MAKESRDKSISTKTSPQHRRSSNERAPKRHKSSIRYYLYSSNLGHQQDGDNDQHDNEDIIQQGQLSDDHPLQRELPSETPVSHLPSVDHHQQQTTATASAAPPPSQPNKAPPALLMMATTSNKFLRSNTAAIPPTNNNNNSRITTTSGRATTASRHCIGSSMLQSLQRRFLSQQTLQTPNPNEDSKHTDDDVGGGGSYGSQQQQRQQEFGDLDGFILHSQPTYERVLSQKLYGDIDGDGLIHKEEEVAGEENGEGEEEEQQQETGRGELDTGRIGNVNGTGDDTVLGKAADTTTTTTTSTSSTMMMATASRGMMGPPPPRLHHQQQQRKAPDQLNVIVTVNNKDNDDYDDDDLKRGGGLTPGLHSVDRVAINGHRSAPRMFPIFRSKKDLKTLYIVRHGESEYNAAISRAGSAWADPQIYDAPLTDKGRRQAAALQAKFASLGVPHHEVLWVTSPLTRAIQTLLLACPVSHLFGDGENRCGGGVGTMITGGGGSMHHHQLQGQQHQGSSSIAPIVHVLPCLTEKVFTTGDVGRQPTALADDFPSLAPQLLTLPETWWYTRSDKPNCGIQKKQLSNEPTDAVQKRIAEFKRWALERPEKVIVAVGHSSYWKTFAKLLGDGSVDSMRNCEVRQLYL